MQELQEYFSQINASKDFIRLSTECFPDSVQMYKDCSIPITAIIQPYAPYPDGNKIPLSNFGSNPILRCEVCRTYVNPFSQFTQGGAKWKCNICLNIGDVPNYYYCQLDEQGYRKDLSQRPELFSGVYDIKAGQEYMARPPVPPVFVFLVDVSKEAVESQMLDIFSSVLKEVIENDLLPGNSRTRIAIITYDSNMHFYNLNPDLKQPQIVVLTDVDEGVIPLTGDLILNVSEQKQQLLQLLDSLPHMWRNNQNQGSCLTQAIKISVQIFKHMGGKFSIFQCNSQISKEVNLQLKTTIQYDQKNYLVPSNNHFCMQTAEMHHSFISCSLFFYSSSFKNLITLSDLVRYLNGDLYHYKIGENEGIRFYNEFKSYLIKDCTWESVFRIRFTSGWKIKSIIGNYSIKSTDLLSVPNMDENKTYMYEFELEFKNNAISDNFSIQTALLYTTSNGERRIRVHNYSCILSSNLSDVYENMDPNVVALSICRYSLHFIYKTPAISDIRSMIYNKIKDIMRKANQINIKKNQQIEDHLYQLILISLGILKHPIYCGKYDASVDCDQINSTRLLINYLPIEEALLHFVPYLFDLSNIENENYCYIDQNQGFIFPNLVSLSCKNLSTEGLYLMDEGQYLIIYIGKNIDKRILRSLFETENLNEKTHLSSDSIYKNQDNPINSKLIALLNILIQRKSSKFVPLEIIFEGQVNEIVYLFFYKLIEDKFEQFKTGYNIGYQEFANLIYH